MAVEDSVAQDQIRAFVERIERLDEELAAINSDKKEIYAEAKGNGFDVAALKQVIKLRRQDENERLEREAIVELYMSALGMIATPDFDEPRVQVQARVREATTSAAENTPSQPTKAAGQAVTAQEPVAASSMENEAAEISTPIPEQQSAPQAASDLTSPSLGQVAANSEPAREGGSQSQEAAGPGRDAAAPSSGEAQRDAGSSNGRTTAFDAANAGSTPAPASKPLYAEPGVVVMEHTPPEGIVAHPYATVWPVNNVDVSEGVKEPIVKIGKMILDGRGRYFAARGATHLDGPMEYPVVQYAGADPLMDCIRWNLASRPGIHPHNLKIIAHKLAKLEPARADDIMQAFGLETAEAAQ